MITTDTEAPRLCQLRLHAMTPDNTITRGRSRCRACARIADRRKKARRRALWRNEHAGHQFTTTITGAPRCLTCWRGDGDIDEIAVARALAGTPPERLTHAELLVVVQKLSSRTPAWSAAQIAQLLGISQRTVVRYRERARQQPTLAAAA